MDEQMNLEQTVDEALAGLTERERYVLEQRYGYRGKPVTQKDLGIEFGVSRARVGQIENNALRKLRHPYQSRKLLPHLYYAISRQEVDFYALFFSKVFKLTNNQECILAAMQARPSIEKPEQSQEESGTSISHADSIERLEFSIHAFNCLIRAKVHTVKDLMKLSDEDLSKIPNLTKKSLAEIREKRSNLSVESADV